MRLLGWLLLIGGGAISTITFLLQDTVYTELNWIATGAMFVGIVVVIYTRRVTLEPGEGLFYAGNAQAGEGNALLGQRTDTLKIAVTSKGIRYGGVFAAKSDQNLIPLENIAGAEKLGPLTVRINIRGSAEETASIKLQFAFWQTSKFLRALASAGVTVHENAIAGASGMEV